MDDGRRNDLDRKPGRHSYILPNLARTTLIREGGLVFSGMIVLYGKIRVPTSSPGQALREVGRWMLDKGTEKAVSENTTPDVHHRL